MRNKRFVLDANIWISYFISDNIESLIKSVVSNKLGILYSTELINEINRVLDYDHLKKYNIDKKYAVSVIKNIGVEFEITYPIKKYISTDDNDNYIIALALQTNSGYVTSGDDDILKEKEKLEKKYTKLKIITRFEFERLVKWEK